MEPGLGKTAIVLQTLEPEHLPVLVVAPKRVAEEVWPLEVAKWRPDLTIRVATGSPKKRQEAMALVMGGNPVKVSNKADIIVIGIENIKDAVDRPWETFVIDELSKFKGRGVRWRHASKISKRAKSVWGLTGTPAPNNLLDLWPQMYLLDLGKRLGTGITGFRNRYFAPGRRIANGTIVEWKPYPETEARIHSLIDDICLSMKAIDHLDVPKVTYNPVRVPIPTAARKVYNEMVQTLVADLRDETGNLHTAANAAVLTGKLSQITAGFLYSEDGGAASVLHEEKFNAVVDLVESLSSPVLIFYRFKAELVGLQQRLTGWKTINDPGVIDQWNRGEVPVLLAHPLSAGHGLNLQAGGHTIVWSTLPWSLEEYIQANARIIRPADADRTEPVMIHQLIVPESVDELILAALDRKRTVQEALMLALRQV